MAVSQKLTRMLGPDEDLARGKKDKHPNRKHHESDDCGNDNYPRVVFGFLVSEYVQAT